MQKLLLSLLLSSAVLHSIGQGKITVPSGQSVELDYPAYQTYSVDLKNASALPLEVTVRSKGENESISGFGMNAKSKAKIIIAKENKLVLNNASEKDINVKFDIQEIEMAQTDRITEYVNLNFRNNSASSIPLIIPGVMNPNLSPFSNSGVSLKNGQEILFREKNKNYVLLTIDSSFQNDQEVDIAAVLKAKKEELGLK